MRHLINLVENLDALDLVLSKIADYIQNNDHPDFHEVSATLKDHGYQEVVRGSRFYRALFHELTPADREDAPTIGDLYKKLKTEVRFDMSRAQGFTTSMDKAIQFVEGTLHITSAVRPIHTPKTSLVDVQNIIMIYEIEANPDSIMFSMQGLDRFMKSLPKGPGWMALDHALHDLWEGYGADDEVVIDTAACGITKIDLYDSSDD